ncbi:probable CoA ligase CCL9 [Syzygium oleosum]|uniref:probable CoA ligase CCL9 n=1 Tax=Syzygium oleosum TaxID=219896 RepID=UPI0024BB3255|nr:probable CoA ligase CCL9 [Syzygium oleosum]
MKLQSFDPLQISVSSIFICLSSPILSTCATLSHSLSSNPRFQFFFVRSVLVDLLVQSRQAIMGLILNSNRFRPIPSIRYLKLAMGKKVTLTRLLKMAATNCPDWTTVSARGGEFDFDLTRARLQELVDHAAALLAAYGIGPGNVVAFAFPYTVEFVILFLAVIRCRAAVALLNPAYKAKEFEYHLSDLRSKLLLTPNEGNQLAQSAASELNIPHLTTRLHSANSKITLSSTNIEPDLDSMSKVVNDPSDVALYLCDSGTPSHKFLGVACVPAFCRRMQFTQKELAIAVEYPFLQDRHLVLAFLSSLSAGTTAAARSSASRFLDKMISGNATRHTAVVGPGVRYRPEVARPDMPEGNNAPTTTEENKTETERGGEEATLTEELANLGGTMSNDMPVGNNALSIAGRGGEEDNGRATLTEELANLGGTMSNDMPVRNNALSSAAMGG